MKRNWIGFLDLGLCLDPAGDAGGGGGTDAGSGGAQDLGGAPAEPSVIELDDNALIKPKGFEKPVKYGEHVRGLQSQFTKASQEAARLKAALQERERRIQQFEQERQRSQPQGQAGQGQPDVYAALEQLPYLTGKDAVEVVRNIGSQIQQRDQILLAALKQMQQMKQTLSGLHQNHTESEFDGRIAKFLQSKGYSPDYYTDIAKEVYLAYEGDNLWDEFPQIFESRIEQLRKAFESERQAKIQANRKQPFIPGKGGQTGPSKPMQFKGNESAAQIAETLFAEMQRGSET